MAESGVRQAGLRSVTSDDQTHVNFINRTASDVTSWWIDFNGLPVTYGDIRPGHVLHMNTFLTHPWMFRASSGGRLEVNGTEVYMPTASQWNDNGHPVYLNVNITCPVYSLKELCLMSVRDLVQKEDFVRLDIPTGLKQDLNQTPDLLREIQELNRQPPS